MPLRFYNTLTRQTEVFTALNPPMVTFYTCGPTVYDYAHIGNFRSFLAADVLRRYLDFSGYQTVHVMNITDVGHMIDDSVADGAGEDKMQVAQRRLLEDKKSGKLPADVNIDPNDPYQIANFYAQAFIEDAKTLGMKVVFDAETRPELLPRPTRYIEQMIQLVSLLLEKGSAYIASDGVVYFDIQSFPAYGKLSGNTLEQIKSGAGGRLDEANQEVKKHPADFMLWKPDPTHMMRWGSPWGAGYPGWHLECSVMAASLLGTDTNGIIDIHSGGEDNIFPHHECELAQSCAASGEKHFSRYWFHPRHLFVEGEKMSKSKGNFFTLREILAKGYEPSAVRMELIKSHYRINANFTMQGLKDSQRIINRWRAFVDKGKTNPVQSSNNNERNKVKADFTEVMDNDLNVAGAIGIINKWTAQITEPTIADADLFLQFDSVLGLLELAGSAVACTDSTLDIDHIETLIAERVEARKNKDYARSDAIRDELSAMGIEIKDSAEGTTWSQRLD